MYNNHIDARGNERGIFMAIDKGLMAGSNVFMLLSLLEEKEYYGYEIIKEIERRSKDIFQLKEGTLYPVLHRMENDGYIQSYIVKSETQRSRKYYKITSLGLKQLKAEQKQWVEFTGSVKRVIGGAKYGCI